MPPFCRRATAFRRLPPFRESVVSASSSGHGSFDSTRSRVKLNLSCWPSVPRLLTYLLLLVSVQCSAVCSYSAVQQWRVRGNCGVCYTRVAQLSPLCWLLIVVCCMCCELCTLCFRAALPPLSYIYYYTLPSVCPHWTWSEQSYSLSLLLSSDLKHFSS